MQQVIDGTIPDRIEEVEEAAFELARLNEQAKALKTEIRKAESVLLSRLEEFGVSHYSGSGVRAFIDQSRKAKVEVDSTADVGLDERPRGKRRKTDGELQKLADEIIKAGPVAVALAQEVIAKKRSRKAKE